MLVQSHVEPLAVSKGSVTQKHELTMTEETCAFELLSPSYWRRGYRGSYC